MNSSTTSVDPHEFALLRVDEAADVLWNLCCAHGSAVSIVRALQARQEDAAAKTIAAITADLDGTPPPPRRNPWLSERHRNQGRGWWHRLMIVFFARWRTPW